MSFEVYLQCYDCGEPAGVPREAVRSLFPVVEAESEPNHWSVRYDELNSCHINVTPLAADAGAIESLCVFRPCSNLRLRDGLLAVMRLGSVVLYFPGSAPPLVATERAGRDLPPDMVETMGKPQVVRSGREIVEAIEGA